MTCLTTKDVETVLSSYIPAISKMKSSYSLATIQAVMDHLGNPEKSLKIIHVAGTSGKTSTCYYLSSLLSSKGLKIGLTVSPHITNVSERAQINGKPLPEDVFVAYFNEFITKIETSNLSPTYFEVVIAFAYWVFAKEKVDYAVIETGLGGLLDGTNVAKNNNKICVLTDIGYDHIDVLGTSIEEISAQKAGIIHVGNHAYTKTQDQKILNVIKKHCETVVASLHVIDTTKNDIELTKVNQKIITSLPNYQIKNWSFARSVLELEGFNFTHIELEKSLQQLIPARMETFHIGLKTIILDGAHNSQKMHTFLDSLNEGYSDEPFTAIVALAENKSERLASALDELAIRANSIIVTEFSARQDYHRQAIHAEEVMASLNNSGAKQIENIKNPLTAIDKALNGKANIIVVTGSFYLISNIRSKVINLAHKS